METIKDRKEKARKRGVRWGSVREMKSPAMLRKVPVFGVEAGAPAVAVTRMIVSRTAVDAEREKAEEKDGIDKRTGLLFKGQHDGSMQVEPGRRITCRLEIAPDREVLAR